MIGCGFVSILQTIKGHEDLISLRDEERVLLCEEIREFLVSNVSKTGGHLASNLGVVELTVAIETVFNTKKDRLVFDVGHQSYVHKLLTGRQADFSHLRQLGGMSGFPKPTESDTDAFVAGHASSSISIALGMARARSLMKQDYDVVALLGDGAATGGMVYEGLNDAAVSREPMVIILNDNEMSIDRNVGGMSRHLSALRTKEEYLGAKRRYRMFLDKIPGGKAVYRITKRVKDWFKRLVLPITLFENMGLTYLGPVDGHDLHGLISLLRIARELKEPVVVHVVTKKGCGYRPAETEPARFHGIGKFDPETGTNLAQKKPTFSDSFGQAMLELAAEDPRVCAITAAMPGGTGLLEFMKQYPKRTFDVGIAEEHAVSMAGGLAKQGMIPVVALYSTFLQRSFDQIMQDIGLLGLHMVLAIDRAGLVGDDGATHHGVFDVGFLRQIPGIRILCPGSMAEQREMLRWAVQDCAGPVAIRYPRGGDGELTQSHWDGTSGVVCHREGSDIALITYGNLTDNVLQAAGMLAKSGVEAKVIRLMTLNPLPVEELKQALACCRHAVVVEEACTGSGIHEALAWAMREQNCPFSHIDLGEDFVTHGSIPELRKELGLDAVSIVNHALEVLAE